jgi:ADP-ribose pyrophosphatase
MAIVYKGRVFSVEVEKRRYPNGAEHEVAIVRHAPSVVIIPFEADGQIVLIRQYRASVDRELWELPAGRVDQNETHEDAARRECEEEIGRVPDRVERLAALYATPGFCDELLVFFRVSDLRPPPANSPHKPDEDEDITARTVSLAEARDMVARGDIVDLKSAYALTLV